jgi:hypothetical protein
MQSSKELKSMREFAKLKSKVEQLEEKFATLSKRLTKLESKNPDHSRATQPEQPPVVTRNVVKY